MKKKCNILIGEILAYYRKGMHLDIKGVGKSQLL